jgi:hypothetical protein
MSAPRPGDMSAGFTGLVVAVVFLFGALSAIVYFTNQKFAGHERARAPAAQPAGQH